MLLDQIQRYEKKHLFKLVNVEKILGKGLKLPSEVHCVPTLMLMQHRKYMHGKQLFDYLLLPNKGILFQTEKKTLSNEDKVPSNIIPDEPLAFSFGACVTGDAFSYIDEQNSADNHKRYVWSSIQENDSVITASQVAAADIKMEEGRTKNSLPDISQLRAERDLDIQNHLNSTTLPPPSDNS